MINTSYLNIDQLAQTYLVANTPSYLYRHYRSDQSVQDFARHNNTEDLVSIAEQISRFKNRTLEDLILAYAAIVALTFKDFREVKDALGRASFTGLDWATDIIKLWDNTRIPTQTINVKGQPIVQTPTRITDASNIIIDDRR